MTPSTYAVRLSERAASQIEAEHDRLELLVGEDVADAWEDGLMDAIASLATLSLRCAIAAENDLFQRVSPGPLLRQLPYRRTRTGPTWRILFSVHEADDQDPPTVLVQRVQHGAQAPLSEWESEME